MLLNCSSDKSRVFITGMGVVSPFGIGLKPLDEALRETRNAITQLPQYSDLPFTLLGATCEDFSFIETCARFSWPEDKSILYKLGRRLPLTLKTAVIAALEAWHQSQLHRDEIDEVCMGIVIAGANTTTHYQYQQHMKNQEELDYLTPTYALHFMDTNLVGLLSELFGIHGEGLSVGGASATGNVGLLQASRMIQSGAVEACMVVGALADLSPMELQAFHNLGVMGGRRYQESPEKASRPFDSQSEGFIYGQGTGCIILECEQSAKKRKVPLIAELASSVLLLDGNSLSNPSIDGEVRSMRKALREAGVDINHIDYINTHGTSTPLGDRAEMAALLSVFGPHIHNSCWVNATKGILGHCLWSAGIIEFIATVLQMQGGYVHGNRNLEKPITEQCRFVGRNTEFVPITTALSNSFGFGGINSSLVVRKIDG